MRGWKRPIRLDQAGIPQNGVDNIIQLNVSSGVAGTSGIFTTDASTYEVVYTGLVQTPLRFDIAITFAGGEAGYRKIIPKYRVNSSGGYNPMNGINDIQHFSDGVNEYVTLHAHFKWVANTNERFSVWANAPTNLGNLTAVAGGMLSMQVSYGHKA